MQSIMLMSVDPSSLLGCFVWLHRQPRFMAVCITKMIQSIQACWGLWPVDSIIFLDTWGRSLFFRPECFLWSWLLFDCKHCQYRKSIFKPSYSTHPAVKKSPEEMRGKPRLWVSLNLCIRDVLIIDLLSPFGHFCVNFYLFFDPRATVLLGLTSLAYEGQVWINLWSLEKRPYPDWPTLLFDIHGCLINTFSEENYLKGTWSNLLWYSRRLILKCMISLYQISCERKSECPSSNQLNEYFAAITWHSLLVSTGWVTKILFKPLHCSRRLFYKENQEHSESYQIPHNCFLAAH